MSTPYVNPSFLRGLTKENVRTIYRRWQFLRSQGATEESNPEFSHLTSILRTIQKVQYTARLQQISQQNQLSQTANIGSSAINENISRDQNPILSRASPALPNIHHNHASNTVAPSSVPPDASANLINTGDEVSQPDSSYPLQGNTTTSSSLFPNSYPANVSSGNAMNPLNYYRSNLHNTDSPMNANVSNMMPNQYVGPQSLDSSFRGNPSGSIYDNPIDSTSLGNGNRPPSVPRNQTPSFDQNLNMNSYTGKRLSSTVPMQPIVDRRTSLSVNPRRSSTPGSSMPTPPYTNYKGESLPPHPITYSPSFPSQPNFPTPGNVSMDSASVPPHYSYGRPSISSNYPGDSMNGNPYVPSENTLKTGASVASGGPQVAPASSPSPNMSSLDSTSKKESVTNRLQLNQGRSPAMNARNPYTPSMPKPSPVPFSPAQLSLLKNQIMAYNSLNSPFGQIPQPIQKAVFGKTLPEVPENPLVNQQTQSKQTKVANPLTSSLLQKQPTSADMHFARKPNSQPQLETARLNPKAERGSFSPHIPKSEDTVKPVVPSVDYSSCINPNSYIQAPISYEKFSSGDNLKLIPSLLSSGLPWDFIFRNSEVAIACSVGNRINSLEDLSVTKGETNFSEKESLDTKQMIELRCLRLLQKQRNLRNAVSSTVQQSETLAAGNLRSMFRTVKHQSLREANATLAVAEQQNNAHVLKQKEKLFSQLRSILQHGQSIAKKASVRKQKSTHIGKDVMSLHAHLEKEEKKRIERSARERLQALRADDEAAYLELVDKAKDSRITHLLRQTDSYLESLTEAVRLQQSTIFSGDTSGKGLKEPFTASNEDEDKISVDYYNVAHRIHEEAEQPNIFVGGNLKDYQLKGLEWMLSLYNNNLNGILADEMGLGKTVQTIAFITYLLEKKNQPGPFLIIVPLSTLTNWNLEFEKWAPSVQKITYRGPPQLRKSLQAQIKSNNFHVLLTTFDYIIKDRPLLSKVKWLHMIIDEGHRMKNTQSKLTSTLCYYYHSQYRLILTGTPLQNNLPELWALLNFVLPKIFNSVKSFDEWFNTPFANTGGQDKFELTEEESLLVIKRLHKVLRPFLFRRLKKDVESELPDKVEKVIKCPLSGLQLKLYQQMKRHGMLFVAGDRGKTGMKGLQNTVMQLKKICNHPFIFEEVEKAIDPLGTNYDLLWRSAGKFELLDRIFPKLFQTGHKTLMFFQMTQIMTIMEDYLRYRNWKYLRLDGSTKSEDRSSLLSQFNDPSSDVYVFMLSTRAGGLGLNLQAADTVIIFDTDWNPHQDLQAQDRAHRIGQTKEVRILRLISEKSIEENILSRAQFKLDLDGKVIQAGKFDNKSTPEEREAFLRSLLEHDGDEDNDLSYSELQNDELNELISRTDDELELFRTIDQERAIKDIYGKGKPFDRLLSVNELPEIYRAEVDHVVQEASTDMPLDAGRQKRHRASVSYAEPGFEDVFEEGNRNDMPRRRGRPRKKVALDNLNYSGPLVYESRSNKRTSEVPSTHKYKALQRCLKEIYESLFYLQDESGRMINGLFLYPPSRKLYPDYYVIIKHPIALGKIGRNIKNNKYTDLQGLVSDFMLMFSNAYTYNEENSPVYEDAKYMERTLTSLMKKIEEENILENYEKEELAKEKVEPKDDFEKDPIEMEESNMDIVANETEFEMDQDFDELTSEE